MNDILYVSNERDKQYIESLQKELDSYQDKVYHTTRLIEQLEHEIELLRKVVQIQREGLEEIISEGHSDICKSMKLYRPTIKCHVEYAQEALKEVDELLKGEK